ncbi:SRPBCC family protein [Streptomyces longispororuber]|uniref:SRPBCC family protein n=1 Tax=Streptomyces longispororuber TaxID=68230 RepID=UPI003405AB88
MFAFATALLAALPLTFGSSGPAPVGIDEKAPVISRDDIVIHAPLDRVWRIQTDVEGWPAWQPGVSSSVKRTPGPLRPGSSWVWSTEGLEGITSTVEQVRPGRRIVWGGPAQGITAVHVWTFTPVRGGVRVHTEESWSGAPVDANTAYLQKALDASLDAWLHHLKQRAEKRHPQPRYGKHA